MLVHRQCAEAFTPQHVELQLQQAMPKYNALTYPVYIFSILVHITRRIGLHNIGAGCQIQHI